MMIEGFSRLSSDEKIKLASGFLHDANGFGNDLESHRHKDEAYQSIYNQLSENSVSNYFLPYGFAPNFLVNGKVYMVPMVTEESSVVAAVAAAAKYWFTRGGFTTRVVSALKNGQVHFTWSGEFRKLLDMVASTKHYLLAATEPVTSKMKKRGGGILDIELMDKRQELPDYYQLHVTFDTLDSMGANFINSVLETIAHEFRQLVISWPGFNVKERNIEIVMAILSNYAPECLTECYVECPVEELTGNPGDYTPEQFARRFKLAVDIAGVDIYRAVTHNKGIFNGMDAVTIATGNDFRAIEAQGHAWASRSGTYRGLTEVSIDDNTFNFKLTLPITIGTVGGITQIHPLAKRSLELLNNPDAKELMQIIATVGLASNFSAIRSLVTSGIQSGHMKLHLANILQSLMASDKEKELATGYFKNKTVSYSAVEEYLQSLRKKNFK
ncbi:MAG: hydroxymethylglutaryl-CoA reductase [Bacteroidales bacterium]|nr:hydroxymethylglutaryl-CoA reductase [Bacteroidales bacterium]